MNSTDFYHATEHLQVFADNIFYTEIERKKWFKQTRSALKKGKINSIIQEMNKLSLECTGERRKNVDREINYFIKGNREGRFNYHKISFLKLPIGSGEAVRCGGSPRCSNCRTRRAL